MSGDWQELDRRQKAKPIDWAKRQREWDKTLERQQLMLRMQYLQRKAREADVRAIREAQAEREQQLNEGYAAYLVAVPEEMGE